MTSGDLSRPRFTEKFVVSLAQGQFRQIEIGHQGFGRSWGFNRIALLPAAHTAPRGHLAMHDETTVDVHGLIGIENETVNDHGLFHRGA